MKKRLIPWAVLVLLFDPSTMLGGLSDDFVYGSLLIVSIPFGFILKSSNNDIFKKIVSAVAGLSIIFTVSGIHSMHSIVTILGNTLLIRILSAR